MTMATSWTELAVGLIMIASPWVLGFSDISLAKWCNVLIGLLLTLMGSWTLFGREAVAAAAPAEHIQKEKINKK